MLSPLKLRTAVATINKLEGPKINAILIYECDSDGVLSIYTTNKDYEHSDNNNLRWHCATEFADAMSKITGGYIIDSHTTKTESYLVTIRCPR